TAVAVGGAVQRLFETLPAAEQRLLADVPDLAARLEARAMRAGGPEATEAMVALETLRRDLMRLRAGQRDAAGPTEDLARLRALGYFVGASDELWRQTRAAGREKRAERTASRGARARSLHLRARHDRSRGPGHPPRRASRLCPLRGPPREPPPLL